MKLQNIVIIFFLFSLSSCLKAHNINLRSKKEAPAQATDTPAENPVHSPHQTIPIEDNYIPEIKVKDSFNTNIAWQKIKDGIDYIYLKNQFSSHVHLVKIDLKNSSLKIDVSPEGDKGRNPMEHSNAMNATIAINAAFFDGKYNPRGVSISRGTSWKTVLYGNSSPFIHCTIENDCEVNHVGSKEVSSSWYSAAGGLHSLVSKGRMRSKSEDNLCGSFCTNLHPRSGVGLTEDRRYLILALAEGRRDEVKGLTLSQFSTMLHYAGAFEAINLDGGGSSSLIIEGRLVSLRPTKEPYMRDVSNSILVTPR